MPHQHTPGAPYRPRIDLPYDKPPITANQKFRHWAERARLVKNVRETTTWLAKAAGLPKHAARVIVQLHWRPKVNRRRDTVNLYPTVKAAVDGLVDYGLVPDDTHDIVSTPEPIIHPAEKNRAGSVWLTIDFPEGTPA